MEIQNIFNAKVLLFGEYSVLHGSHALAIPTGLFSGFLTFDPQESKQQREILSQFHIYLSNLEFDQVNYLNDRFLKDLENHLVFESDIPIGYGVGSSGAITAAIFDRYFQKDNQLDIPTLKGILGKMESFFHGSSSGLDPLICFLNQAILIKKGEPSATEVSNLPGDYDLFLLDTGHPRKTAPLVNHFLEQYHSDDNFRKIIRHDLSELNNLAIQHFLEGADEELYKTFHEISDFQWKHFQKMIPENIRSVWQFSLDLKMFKLKLCGAGGGGFLLGMTPYWKRLKREGVFGDFNCLKLNF